MDKYLGKDIENKAERIAFLADNCDAVEERGYMRPYSPDMLPIKEPVKMAFNGTINSVCEFIAQRKDTFDHKKARIEVERTKTRITLVFNEDDPYKCGQVNGALEYHPKFLAFGINADKVWNPAELGMFIKMNRTFFADKATNMKLVSTFMQFKATVNANVERDIKQNGSCTDNYAQVVNSNLPEAFNMNIPIFKGFPAECLEIETFAKIDGRDVGIMLISPGAECTLESMRDAVIDEQLNKIREIAPDIVILEK